MPAISKYDPAWHDDWAWSMAVKGATNEEMAQAFRISARTFIRWTKKFKSLREAVERGKYIADSKVEKALYERATGYTVTDEEKLIEYDKDGNVKPVRVKKQTKNVAPDTMAIMYWLNNRKRNHWSQKQDIALSASENVEDVVIVLPSNGRDVHLQKPLEESQWAEELPPGNGE